MNDIDRARSALHAIDSGCPRDEWVRCAMAAKAAGLSFDDFHEWSECAHNYRSETDCRAVWKSIDEAGGIGAGTLFAKARDAGWREPMNGHRRPRSESAARTRQNGAQRPKHDAQAIWDSCEPATPAHGYIDKKRGLCDGLRVVPDSATLALAQKRIAGWLAVPLTDADGTLRTIQFIAPEGDKLSLAGHPMVGWFIAGGAPGDGEPLFVVEGIGAAWSALQATTHPAAVTFSAGRMKDVASALRDKYPRARLVVVADRGKERESEALARELGCAWAGMPEGWPSNSDVNDLHARDGLQAVADLLAQARTPEPASEPEESDPDEPREIDLAALAATTPQPPAFIVPDWLPAGEITLLAANGGTGKSAMALRLAVCLRTGRDFYGLPVDRRGVDFVSFEDAKPVIHWRLHRICQAIGVDLHTIADGLRIFDGTQCMSAWYSRGQYGETGPTAAFHAMAGRIGGPGRVVVVDGSSDTFAGNENDRAQVKGFIRMLRRLVAPDGALLLLAHVDKLAAKSGADSLGFSGSTGWNNGVRCRWFMYAETDDEGTETGAVALEVRKSNLGRTGHRMLLRFDEASGTFERVDTEQPHRGRAFQRADEADAIVAMIRAAWAAGDPIPAATAGTRTAHSVCDAREGLPASLKGRRGRARFNRALEELRAAGAVRVETTKRAGRKIREVLYAPE